MTEGKLILVTGATGYVGGRLVPRLLEAEDGGAVGEDAGAVDVVAGEVEVLRLLRGSVLLGGGRAARRTRLRLGGHRGGERGDEGKGGDELVHADE